MKDNNNNNNTHTYTNTEHNTHTNPRAIATHLKPRQREILEQLAPKPSRTDHQHLARSQLVECDAACLQEAIGEGPRLATGLVSVGRFARA